MKDAAEVPSSTEEYQRLEYSLKLNLRLVNGRFKDMKIYQINSSSVSFAERFMDRTQIETMEMVTAANADTFETLTRLRGRLNISRNSPKKFTFGTIVENADDISQDQEYTFCVFRVGVGKSYVHKVSANDDIDSIPLKDGYDSVYLESGDQSRVFQMQYMVYHADNVILTHVIKCRIDVEEFRAYGDIPTCKICQANAHVYCENDHEYFCQTCDELAHEGDENEGTLDERTKILNQLRVTHIRVPIQDSGNE